MIPPPLEKLNATMMFSQHPQVSFKSPNQNDFLTNIFNLFDSQSSILNLIEENKEKISTKVAT